MLKDSYFKENLEICPILDSPVLFLLLGERGKNFFPFLQKMRRGLENSVQILQIAKTLHRIENSQVFFVDVNKTNLNDGIKELLGQSIIPRMKNIAYGKPGRAIVNVIVDASEEHYQKIEGISESIYDAMKDAFVNDIGIEYFCFADIEFKGDNKFGTKNQVMDYLKNLKRNHKWVRMLYVMSDINQDDLYMEQKNQEQLYLPVGMNMFLTTNYRNDESEDVQDFNPWLYSEKHAEKVIMLNTMGCTALSLDKDLLSDFFKWQLMEWFKKQPCDIEEELRDIFVPKGGSVSQIIKELLERSVSQKLLGAEYVAYNGKITAKELQGLDNAMILRRLYTDNLEKYLEENIKKTFAQKQMLELSCLIQTHQEKFCKKILEGRINPFVEDPLKTIRETFITANNDCSAQKKKLQDEKETWKKKVLRIRKTTNVKYTENIRVQLLNELIEFEKRELLLEGEIRYLQMQKDSIAILENIIRDCKKEYLDFQTKKKRDYEQRKQMAQSFHRECLEDYYCEKIEETIQNSMTRFEVDKLYQSICVYMLNGQNYRRMLDVSMDDFLANFWRQGDFKEDFVEELLDRKGITNTDKVHVQKEFENLYNEVCCEQKLNLRVVNIVADKENEICCFMGPRNNLLISYLEKNKKNLDNHVKIKIVEQLEIPMVLYYKFNIDEVTSKILI